MNQGNISQVAKCQYICHPIIPEQIQLSLRTNTAKKHVPEVVSNVSKILDSTSGELGTSTRLKMDIMS